MREIKFRGMNNKHWVYGSLLCLECGDYYILFEVEGNQKQLQIHPETIEQYTGLKDKNGKEIYEGDIVSIHLSIDQFEEKEIIYDDENCCFTFKNTHEDPHCQFSDYYKIIGNKHEADNAYTN